MSIRISTLTGAAKEELAVAAEGQGLSLLSQVVEFQLIVTAGDEWVEITDFGGTYMTKSIVLDEQFAESKLHGCFIRSNGWNIHVCTRSHVEPK